MFYRCLKILPLCLAVCISVFLSASLDAESRRPEFLILYSYENTIPVFEDIERGFVSFLRCEKISMSSVYQQYLDIKRFPSGYDRRFFAEFLKNKYGKKKFDAIITILPPAYDFMKKEGRDLFPQTPVVAALPYPGVETEGRRKVYSLLYKADLTDSASIARRLFPSAQKLAFVCGSSEIDIEIHNTFFREIKSRGDSGIIDLSGLSRTDMLGKIAELPEGTPILFSTFYSDIRGETFMPNEILFEITRSAKYPVFSFSHSYMGRNVVGGRLLDYSMLGEKSAEIAVRIFRKDASVPSVSLMENHHVFDWKELRKWKIDKAMLPPESIILNYKASFWEKYKIRIIISFFVLLGLVIFLGMFLVQKIKMRRTEKQLKESSILLKAQFENSPDQILIIDNEYRVVTVNRLISKDRFNETARGKPISDFLPSAHYKRLLPVLEKCRVNNCFDETEYDWEEVYYVRIRIVPIELDGVVSRLMLISSDITPTKVAEKALRGEMQKMKLYLDTVESIIIALDLNGGILILNRKGGQVLGINPEEAVGRRLFEHFLRQGEMCDGLLNYFRTMVSGKIEYQEYFESALPTLDGRDPVISWHAGVMRDESGSIKGLLISGDDVTMRRKAEDAEKILREHLARADRMTSLGLIVSGVAHEINNPNQYILSNLEILAQAWNGIKPVLDEYYRENGEFLVAGLKYSEINESIPDLFLKVKAGSERIKMMVDELKGYSKSEEDDLPFIDLNASVFTSAEMLRSGREELAAKIHFELQRDLPLVRGVRQRIEQVIVNILQNAMDALVEEKSFISVSSGVSVDGRVYLSVFDSGCGMEKKVLQKLSEPFFTTKRNRGGTGLGLFVSYKILKSYKADINYVSVMGMGTCVTIKFPRADKPGANVTY